MRLRDALLILVAFAGIAAGILLPQWGKPLEWFPRFSLMIILYLSFLGLKTDTLFASAKKLRPKLTMLVAGKLLLVPLVTFFILSCTMPKFALGGLLLAGAPAGVTSSVFAALVGADFTLAVMGVVLTSLFPLYIACAGKLCPALAGEKPQCHGPLFSPGHERDHGNHDPCSFCTCQNYHRSVPKAEFHAGIHPLLGKHPHHRRFQSCGICQIFPCATPNPGTAPASPGSGAFCRTCVFGNSSTAFLALERATARHVMPLLWGYQQHSGHDSGNGIFWHGRGLARGNVCHSHGAYGAACAGNNAVAKGVGRKKTKGKGNKRDIGTKSVKLPHNLLMPLRCPEP